MKMLMLKWFVVRALQILLFTVLTACGSTAPTLPALSPALQPIGARDLQIVTGQTVYVPAYSEVFLGRGNTSLTLAVTLAIHNTDPDSEIIIQSVQYFDTDGVLVRDYVSEPVAVRPLATTGFIVEDRDTSGGWGANFIVEWGAEQPVYEPVIEAIMISTQGTYGVSMISPGRVVSQSMPAQTLPEATPEEQD